jgi:hypothetical protein
VTVAFGSRDLVLLKSQSRHIDQLPPGTDLEVLPGCGHLPMADDPIAVARLTQAETGRRYRPGRSWAYGSGRSFGTIPARWSVVV